MSLEEALDITRKHYPSYLEFVRSDHSEKIKRILDSIAQLKGEMLVKYSFTLRDSDLEYVLPALVNCKDERICNMLEDILELRFRKKLYELNWIMLQMDFTNRNLLETMNRMLNCLKNKYPQDYAASLFTRLDAFTVAALNENLPESMCRVLVAENIDIDTFSRKYALFSDGALAKKMSELFFLKSSKNGFTRNRDVFTGLLDDKDAPEAVPLLACYFEKLEVYEYFDELNYSLMRRFGEPGVSGEKGKDDFWELLPKACSDKFSRWQDLKRIEYHFGKSSKDFILWVSYIDKMKKVDYHEHAGLLFMDFGPFVVVDSREGFLEDGIEGLDVADKKISYLIDRKYFDHVCESHKPETAEHDGNLWWRIIAGHMVDARELIIEDIKSEVYRVGYNKVQLLYLKEILRVKLENGRDSH